MIGDDDLTGVNVGIACDIGWPIELKKFPVGV